MLDHIEKFIQDHRASFDDKDPPADLWQKIEKDLPVTAKVRPLRFRQIFKIAAAVIALVGIGAILGAYFTNQQHLNAVAYHSENALPEEFLEAQTYYQGEIARKVSLLQDYEGIPEINQDLAQLEDFMADLQQELKNAPPESRENIINAMLQNYQTRIGILEHVLQKLDDYKKTKEDNEKHIQSAEI